MSVEVSVVVSVGTGTESVVVPPTSVSVVVGSSCARIGSARANKAAIDVRVKIFMVKGIRGCSLYEEGNCCRMPSHRERLAYLYSP